MELHALSLGIENTPYKSGIQARKKKHALIVSYSFIPPWAYTLQGEKGHGPNISDCNREVAALYRGQINGFESLGT